MCHAMEIITDSTYPKLYKPSFRRLFLFVTSIARTNLEAEIIQRGGSLCSNNGLRYKPKRECLGENIYSFVNCLHRKAKFLIFTCFNFIYSSTAKYAISSFTIFGRMAIMAIICFTI